MLIWHNLNAMDFLLCFLPKFGFICIITWVSIWYVVNLLVMAELSLGIICSIKFVFVQQFHSSVVSSSFNLPCKNNCNALCRIKEKKGKRERKVIHVREKEKLSMTPDYNSIFIFWFWNCICLRCLELCNCVCSYNLELWGVLGYGRVLGMGLCWEVSVVLTNLKSKQALNVTSAADL